MPERQTDVVILTVIPAELHAALSALGIPEGSRRKDELGTVYHYGQIASRLGGRSLSVVVGCIGMAGNPSAAAAAAEFIQSHQPKAFFLLGIAAGLRGKIKIGEVIFSDRVVAYEPEALVREAERAWSEPRPDIDRIPHAMHQDLIAYRCDLARIAWRAQQMGLQVPRPSPGQETEFQQHVASTAGIRIATIASGEKLLRDPAKLHAVQAQIHGKIEAGEMEAAGIVSACSRRGIPWLVVRGISDFGDELKNDAFHGYAAGLAAATLADFIEHGLDLGPAERAGSQQPLAISVTELTWPHADFSFVNTTDHPIQVTGVRIRRVAVLPHVHTDWRKLLQPGGVPRAERIKLSVDWNAPRAADGINVLGEQVLNLQPGAAEAFRLELAVKEMLALVALEIDWISAKSPKKSVLHWPELLAVHPSFISYDDDADHGLQKEGAISVVSREVALDCLVHQRSPALWEGRSFAHCDGQELLARAAGYLARSDPEGSFERLRQVQASSRFWGSILASFANAYEPSATHLWERLESSVRESMRGQHPSTAKTRVRVISVDDEDAHVIIDRLLARRQGSKTEWLLGFIDSDLEALSEFSPLQAAAFAQLATLKSGRSAEYLIPLALVTGLSQWQDYGLMSHLIEALSVLPSPPPEDVRRHLAEAKDDSTRTADDQLVSWWKQTRLLQPMHPVFHWRPLSPRLARFWDMLLCDAGEQELITALQSSEPLVRYAVAMRPDLPHPVAMALTGDTSAHVKDALAMNPATSRGVLQVLSRHDDCRVASCRLLQWPHLTLRELGDGLGYIHVPHFKDDRMVEKLGQALEQFREARGLILDVRHAYAGEKSVARRMLDRVVPRGQPWTSAVPMVVLVNQRGAELELAAKFALALEQVGRAKVIRTRMTALDHDPTSASDPLFAEAREALRTQGSRPLPDA
jgi:nucleoside phosphorylase